MTVIVVKSGKNNNNARDSLKKCLSQLTAKKGRRVSLAFVQCGCAVPAET